MVYPDNLRSSGPEVFLEISVLKISREFPGNHARWSAFNSKKIKHSWEFSKIIQNSSSNISGWVLLQIVWCPKELLSPPPDISMFPLLYFRIFNKLKKLTFFHSLKVHQCRSENLPICLCSYKNNTLKILHSYSQELSSDIPVKCVKCLFTNIQKRSNMLKISLLFKKNTNFTGE